MLRRCPVLQNRSCVVSLQQVFSKETAELGITVQAGIYGADFAP